MKGNLRLKHNRAGDIIGVEFTRTDLGLTVEDLPRKKRRPKVSMKDVKTIKDFSDTDKKDMLKMEEENIPQREIAACYGTSQRTISTILMGMRGYSKKAR